MSKDADKDVGDPTGTPRTRRRRKKSGLRIPSDNVPRTTPATPMAAVDDAQVQDEDDVSRDGVVSPVPEDPNVAVSVAYAFGAGEKSDGGERTDTELDPSLQSTDPDESPTERQGRPGTLDGGQADKPTARQSTQAEDEEDEDLETRKTTQMPAIRLEDLGLVGLGSDGNLEDEDDDEVEIDIDEDEPQVDSGGVVEPVNRAATVALSDEDLEELMEPSDSTLTTDRLPAQRAVFGNRRSSNASSNSSSNSSIDARVTQPIPVLSESALAAYVEDDDEDVGITVPTKAAKPTRQKPARNPEPGVPAAVAALEDAGVESPHDTPLSFGDAGDSGEIISDELEDLIEEVDDSDVQIEAEAPKSPPPTPPAAQPARKPPPAPRNKAAKAQTKPKRRKGKPWFEEIFDEDYLRTLPFLTPQATQAEAAFVSSALEAEPGAHVLDIGCGYGRHAMELAARGYQVVALDLSLPLLLRGADEAQRRGLNINFVHGDMRELSFDGQFDGAYCLFSTFGYFDDVANKKTMEGIARALKPGGRLVIEVLNRDYLIADLPARVWWEGDGCVVLEEVDFNYFSSRIMSRRSVVFDDGRQLEQEISLRAYSLHEFGKLLHSTGFRVIEISGSMATRGRFFGNQSREIIIVAAKREAGPGARESLHQFPRGGTSSESSFSG